MSNVLQAIMTDFGRQTGGPVPQCTPDGQVHFQCDGRYSVMLFDDAVTGCVHAVGLAGYLPPEARDDDADEEWESIAREADGLDDCEECHHAETGAVLVTAAAPAISLDSVTFTAWLERFLDELEHVAEGLTGEAAAQSAGRQDGHDDAERVALAMHTGLLHVRS